MKKIYCLFFISLIQIISMCVYAQGTVDFIRIKEEGNKKFINNKNANDLHVFKNEILPFSKQGKILLPNDEEVLIDRKDYEIYESLDTLSETECKNIIRKQRFLNNSGNIEIAYMIDLSDWREKLEKNQDIKIASYESSKFTFKNNNPDFAKKYPYEPNGMKTKAEISKFPDKYIRIIKPGYATCFIDTSDIKLSEQKLTYDEKYFNKYELQNSAEGADKRFVLIDTENSKYYVLDYPELIHLNNSVDKGAVYISTDKLNKVVFQDSSATVMETNIFEKYLPINRFWRWGIIIGSALFLICLLIFIFRIRKTDKQVNGKKKNYTSIDEKKEKSYDITNTKRGFNNPKKPNTVKSKPDEITIAQIQQIIKAENKIIIDNLNNKFQDIVTFRLKENKTSLLDEIRKVITNTLNSEKDTLKNLNREIDGLKKDNSLYKQEWPLLEKYKNQAVFLEGYTDLTDKFLQLNQDVEKVENEVRQAIERIRDYNSPAYGFLIKSYMKYSLIDKTKYKHYIQILKTFKKQNGLLIDLDEKKLFKENYSSDSGKYLKYFKEAIVTQTFHQNIGGLLIFIEEMIQHKNICGSEITGLENMEKYKKTVRDGLKFNFKIDTPDIKLFSDISEYSDLTSKPGKSIYTIKKKDDDIFIGSILEITEYGMKGGELPQLYTTKVIAK